MDNNAEQYPAQPNKDREAQKLTEEIGRRASNVKTLQDLIQLDNNNPTFPLKKVLPPAPQNKG